MHINKVYGPLRFDRTDCTHWQHTVPWCHNSMHALYVLRIPTVNNSDGLYGAYHPSTALSIQTIMIRTHCTDHTNRNTLCSDLILRCMLCMCSEYWGLATVAVCIERAIRHFLWKCTRSEVWFHCRFGGVLDCSLNHNISLYAGTKLIIVLLCRNHMDLGRAEIFTSRLSLYVIIIAMARPVRKPCQVRQLNNS